MIGMTPEECVLIAIAFDLEHGEKTSPLLSHGIVEIGVDLLFTGMMDIVRVLVVTAEERTDAQLITML